MIWMNEIEIKLTFNDYDLKPVKPTSTSSIVYVRKDWLGKTVNLIPVPDYVTKEMIEEEKRDGEYKLIIYTNKMLQKVVKVDNHLARRNLPANRLGYYLLIIESPKIDL